MVGAMIFFLGGGVIHPLSPNNDQQSAGILHISSIATNNDQCLEKKNSSGRRFLSGQKTFPDTMNNLSTGAGKA